MMHRWWLDVQVEAAQLLWSEKAGKRAVGYSQPAISIFSGALRSTHLTLNVHLRRRARTGGQSIAIASPALRDFGVSKA